MANIPLSSSGSTTSAISPTPLRGGEPAIIPATVQAGPSVYKIDSQTVLSQLACGSYMTERNIPLSGQGSSTGPLSGVMPNLRVLPGTTSELAAKHDPQALLVVNALRRSAGLEAKQASLSASERFFYTTLELSFNREQEHKLNAEKVPTAEMAKALALATGGVLSTNDLTQLVNSGSLGYTSQRSLNTYSRLESGGLQRIRRRS